MTPDTGTLAGTALETLGQILDKDLGRDAIHLATISVASPETLWAGMHVGLLEDEQVGTKASKLIGIVDPFLLGAVYPGQRFWLVLYPRTITSLRHVWTHPAFDLPQAALPLPKVVNLPFIVAAPDKAASEQWLRAFCENSGVPSYESVMEILKGENDDGSYVSPEYFHISGRDASGDIPPEFWEHVEVVLGRKQGSKPPYFTCGC